MGLAGRKEPWVVVVVVKSGTRQYVPPRLDRTPSEFDASRSPHRSVQSLVSISLRVSAM
jgi:hypothetical protein